MTTSISGIKPAIDLGGGESVYCINQLQMKKAIAMFEDDQKGAHLRAVMATLESELSRNELAALSFILLDKLRR